MSVSGDRDGGGGDPKSLGLYRLERPLGKGGRGVVYLGRHERTSETAAIKTVRAPSEALLAGVRREVRCAAPAVVVVGVCRSEETGNGLRELALHDEGRDQAVTAPKPHSALPGPGAFANDEHCGFDQPAQSGSEHSA
ncbi:MAG: hypothetical protein HYV63_16525 [Candidatus Schekmanbacteria bacterium]|nr:hypothetical protein [Candidatus Schekmanbacteria bacterium]